MRSTLSPASRRFRAATAGALLGGISLAVSACAASTAAPGIARTHRPASQSSTAPADTSAPVGAGCGMFWPAGAGRTRTISMDKVITAAARDPRLSRLATAAARAGLTAELNSLHPITLIAPANSAFMHVPMKTAAMLRGKASLGKVLRYHVVAAAISPAQMAHGIRASTLEGSALTFSKKGSAYQVNGATVLCGNIHTANARLYIIDKVLTPPR